MKIWLETRKCLHPQRISFLVFQFTNSLGRKDCLHLVAVHFIVLDLSWTKKPLIYMQRPDL